MGVLSFLLGKTLKLDDVFFGEMVFVEIPDNPAQSYFECEHPFNPSGEMIGLSVTGSLSGPTQRQKDFFTQVENDYKLLVVKLTPIIKVRFSSWATAPVIKDFEAEFKPTYFSIPTCDQQPIKWEIAFDTVHDLNHTVTVEMLDYEPQYVRLDG